MGAPVLINGTRYYPSQAERAASVPLLLELKGTDLRREPIEVRKAKVASILRKSRATACA